MSPSEHTIQYVHTSNIDIIYYVTILDKEIIP